MQPKNNQTPAAKDSDPVVFSILTNTKCSDCGEDLGKGSLLFKQEEKGLCMECADMDHLVYIPAGDPALTRRSRKYSRLSAIVVQWSRSRKRYERQGILVEEEAYLRAEEECATDAEKRERRAKLNRVREAELDKEYIANFAAAIRVRFPGCPPEAEGKIAEHACTKYSGRVGRSASAKQFDEKAIDLAVQAHIRHTCTNYDDFLMRNWDRRAARNEIREQVEDTMAKWMAAR